MNAKSVQCPSCGKAASGRFCSHCGTALASTCPSCGAEVKAGARACPACGASLTGGAAPKTSSAQAIAAWAAIGIAAIALIVAAVSLLDRADRAPAPVPSPSLSSAPPAPGQPVDLSTMTPRQAADRLFNRVMAAGERGDMAEALRFAPMALAAYDNLGTLDNDARYHVALIHMMAEDIKSARVQLEKIRESAPDHLLAIMLDHQIAERSGDKVRAARAHKAFLAAYDNEIAAGRPEYLDHQNTVERFRTAARASIAGKK